MADATTVHPRFELVVEALSAIECVSCRVDTERAPTQTEVHLTILTYKQMLRRQPEQRAAKQVGELQSPAQSRSDQKLMRKGQHLERRAPHDTLSIRSVHQSDFERPLAPHVPDLQVHPRMLQAQAPGGATTSWS